MEGHASFFQVFFVSFQRLLINVLYFLGFSVVVSGGERGWDGMCLFHLVQK